MDRATFGPYLTGRGGESDAGGEGDAGRESNGDGGGGKDDGADGGIPTTDVARESWPSFNRRLCREVLRVEGADEVAARARRRAAQNRRGVRGEICDDGLGVFSITGPNTSVVAALDRIETVARRARKAGDPRPLDHIRSDTAMALLVHGTVPLPGQDEGRCADGNSREAGSCGDDHARSEGGERGCSDGAAGHIKVLAVKARRPEHRREVRVSRRYLVTASSPRSKPRKCWLRPGQ